MTRKIKGKKKIGLALGGGAVLGAAHVGVLRALDEADITISYISGTSIGGFVAALFAFGRTWMDIEEIALDLNWFQAMRLKFSKFAMFSNEKLGDSVREMLGDVRFEEANIPLAMVATDICNGDKVVLDSGDVARAVMATTCLPAIFAPVEANGKLLIDGGVVDNVPVSTLYDMGARFTIGVDLLARHTHRQPENIIEVMMNTFDFTLRNASRDSVDRADILIAPPLEGYNAIDTGQIADLIELGYEEARKVLGI
jgi:NTE family protein